VKVKKWSGVDYGATTQTPVEGGGTEADRMSREHYLRSMRSRAPVQWFF